VEITETLYVASREAWRVWLAANHAGAREIWLVSYRKEAGKRSVPYGDAVEEALCFGWIDSTRKGLDDRRYAQRFSPRRPGSAYSQTNKERLRLLAAEERLLPEVLAAVTGLLQEQFEHPPHIMDALRANGRAWANFQRYPAAYQRIRLAYVNAARDRPKEFEKRLQHLLRMTEEDRQFGYGIERFNK